MSLGSLWAELEAEAPRQSGVGRRRLYASSAVDLNVTLAMPGSVRGLALTIADDAVSNVDRLPTTRGLDHRRYASGSTGHTVLELRLTESGANDLFVALADDVAGTTAKARDDNDAVGLWLSRITRWQRLMATASRGLGPERQCGLFAELLVLREHLVGAVGVESAVNGWEGPRGGHDFQLPGGSFEVKSSASHEPQVMTINSERQLDETGTDSLHVIHLSLDVHQHAGETLPDIVASVRALVHETSVEDSFEERLLDAMYADIHEPHYRATGYTVREERFLRVEDGFPRLVESDLPEGVGGVTYKLVVAACVAFETAPATALGRLKSDGR